SGMVLVLSTGPARAVGRGGQVTHAKPPGLSAGHDSRRSRWVHCIAHTGASSRSSAVKGIANSLLVPPPLVAALGAGVQPERSPGPTPRRPVAFALPTRLAAPCPLHAPTNAANARQPQDQRERRLPGRLSKAGRHHGVADR